MIRHVGWIQEEARQDSDQTKRRWGSQPRKQGAVGGECSKYADYRARHGDYDGEASGKEAYTKRGREEAGEEERKSCHDQYHTHTYQRRRFSQARTHA